MLQKNNYQMKTNNRQLLFSFLVIATLFISACQQKQISYTKIEPAKIEHIEGSDISKLTLTEKAAERTGIKTSKVSEEDVSDSDAAKRKVVPYSSVLYDTEGKTWVYTNPNPLVFVRHEIKIDFIEGNRAILSEGPLTGTEVVTIGAAELLGTEYHVGH